MTFNNPSCGATVPLVRQTWLCKNKGKYVAWRMIADRDGTQSCATRPAGASAGDSKGDSEDSRPKAAHEVRVEFEVVESKTEKGLGDCAIRTPPALASSIFLVARKRETGQAGSYETEVQPELDAARSGPGLSGGEAWATLATTSDEQAALQKLLANWRTLIGEGGLFG